MPFDFFTALENPTQLNKDIQRTDLPKKEKSNTDLSSTHSIPILSPNPSPCGGAATPPERKGTEAAAQSAVEIYREIIKDNIDYDILKQDMKFDGDRLDEIVDLIGNFRQGNNRQLQHFRNQRAGAFAWAELSEIGKGAYDTGRNRGHGRREMYLAATRGAPVLFGQIRHNEAPEIQVPVRCRPEDLRRDYRFS